MKKFSTMLMAFMMVLSASAIDLASLKKLPAPKNLKIERFNRPNSPIRKVTAAGENAPAPFAPLYNSTGFKYDLDAPEEEDPWYETNPWQTYAKTYESDGEMTYGLVNVIPNEDMWPEDPVIDYYYNAEEGAVVVPATPLARYDEETLIYIMDIYDFGQGGSGDIFFTLDKDGNFAREADCFSHAVAWAVCYYDEETYEPIDILGHFGVYAAMSYKKTVLETYTMTYTATEKLPQVTSSNASGLHTNAFNVSITGHTFSDGIGTITFAGEVKSIGDSAFRGCSGLTSITIPNSVTSIGGYAFAFSGLTSITIPNSVTSIGDRAFYCCSGLTSITIPNSVTSIGDNAFYNCSGLTSITIPNSVTSIGSYAFYNCSGLTSVTIPNSVTSIGGSAFSDCSSLTSISIPNSVTSIGDRAFYGCSGLTSITIPNSVTSIGDRAFYRCSGLTSIVVESGNTNYDSRDNCNAIIETSTNTLIAGCQKTVIPNSVTSIGDRAFSYCSGLTSVTIPNSVTSIGSFAFYNCSGLTSVTIPNSVTSIGGSAFSDCSSLTSISIPNSVTSIGSYAFSDCSSLTSISIPNSVTSIGDRAFYNCSGLTSITISNSVTSIGDGAFYGCLSLIELQVDAIVPPTIESNTFEKVTPSLFVYVPAESVNAYRTAQYWNQFVNIKPQALPQATLTLNADSEMGAAYGAGTYDKGSDVQIFAIDNRGYEFTGWSDGNTDNPRTITLTDNLTLTANFEKIEVAEYTINVSAINPTLGTATASELVLVEAVPYPGCTFVCWSDGNFENPRYIPLTGDINLSAIFTGTPTSVAETTDKAQGIVHKVIVDGQLHIIRSDKTYTVEGSIIK